ncbi:MAG: hypothetical protein ACI9OJ_002674 [Myxococcota bacterium]
MVRSAFSDTLPREVVDRPKASFPLPFQKWMGTTANTQLQSGLLSEVFNTDALEMIASDPAAHWQLAWPVLNVGRWMDRWWGNGSHAS